MGRYDIFNAYIDSGIWGGSGGPYTAYVDDIHISTVPKPGTLAMLGTLGLVLLGYACAVAKAAICRLKYWFYHKPCRDIRQGFSFTWAGVGVPFVGDEERRGVAPSARMTYLRIPEKSAAGYRRGKAKPDRLHRCISLLMH